MMCKSKTNKLLYFGFYGDKVDTTIIRAEQTYSSVYFAYNYGLKVNTLMRDLSSGREIIRSRFVDTVQGITYPDDDRSFNLKCNSKRDNVY